MKENEKVTHKQMQLVIFRLQHEEFGIDITCVKEILRMLEISHIPDAPGFLEGVINLRGHVIAVVNLAKQFGFPLCEEASKKARIIVVENGKTNIGLMVDEVPQILSISQSEIENTPELLQTKIKSDYLLGIGKLGERLIIILDMVKILTLYESKVPAEIVTGETNG